MRRLTPITPGELLSEDFLKPMGLSQNQMAKEIGVPPQRISEIVAGKRRSTADTDIIWAGNLIVVYARIFAAGKNHTLEITDEISKPGCFDSEYPVTPPKRQ